MVHKSGFFHVGGPLVNWVLAWPPDPASVATGSPDFHRYVLPTGYCVLRTANALTIDRTRRATPDSSPRIGRPPVGAPRLGTGKAADVPQKASAVGMSRAGKECWPIFPPAFSPSQKPETGADPPNLHAFHLCPSRPQHREHGLAWIILGRSPKRRTSHDRSVGSELQRYTRLAALLFPLVFDNRTVRNLREVAIRALR